MDKAESKLFKELLLWSFIIDAVPSLGDDFLRQ